MSSEAQKQKRRDRMRAHYHANKDNPEWVAAQNAIRRRRYMERRQSPELRAKHSAAQRQYYAQKRQEDPTYGWGRQYGAAIREAFRAQLTDPDFRCPACGITLAELPDAARVCVPRRGEHVRFHVDHIIPVARGGTDDLANLRLLCPDCNYIKGANIIDDVCLGDVVILLREGVRRACEASGVPYPTHRDSAQSSPPQS